MTTIEHNRDGWVLEWATNANGEHPTVMCDHWIDTPPGRMADCLAPATRRGGDEDADDRHACEEHAEWLRDQQISEDR